MLTLDSRLRGNDGSTVNRKNGCNGDLNEKPLKWIGSSYKDLLALPSEVRSLFGFALSLAQAGEKHETTKVLKGFGGAGVLEVIESDAHGTYRAVYTVKFEETPKEDMDIIHARLKIAAIMAEELRNAKENH